MQAKKVLFSLISGLSMIINKYSEMISVVKLDSIGREERNPRLSSINAFTSNLVRLINT